MNTSLGAPAHCRTSRASLLIIGVAAIYKAERNRRREIPTEVFVHKSENARSTASENYGRGISLKNYVPLLNDNFLPILLQDGACRL
jgi:hypothetical protein